MLGWIDNALTYLQQDRAMLVVVLVLTCLVSVVFTMLGGAIRESLALRRERRYDEQAEYEAERIRQGWNGENSDEWQLANETYHAATPREQRTLTDTWRQRVQEAAQPVMEKYEPRRNWGQYNQPTQQWPTWTEQEMAIPGRHRLDETIVIDAMPVSPGQGYTPRQLRALVTQTGQFSVLTDRELVGVGS